MDFRTWPLLLVVDTEGNGAQPPDLVEVAAVPVREGRLDQDAARAWLIRPPKPVTAAATRVHGLSNAGLVSAPSWETVADQVRTTLGSAWIAAHNAHTDHRVLAAHLPGWSPDGVIDTLRLARTVHPGLRSYTLDHLIQHFQPGLADAPAQRHRAGYDAYAAGQLLLAMSSGMATFHDLIAVSVPPALPGAVRPAADPTLW